MWRKECLLSGEQRKANSENRFLLLRRRSSAGRRRFLAFRDFLAGLDRTGQLTRFQEPVATELEITELADREMKKPGGASELSPGDQMNDKR